MNVPRRLPASLRLLLWFALALAVPVLPFLALGWYIEPQIEGWIVAGRHWPGFVALFGVVTLASDIFLPIPSSLVCTTLGQVLGVFWGTVACVAGLQFGAWIGWSASKTWGENWIERTGGTVMLDEGARLLDKWGVWAIVLSRPIPLVAEAVVLLLGTHPGPFRRWGSWLLLSNLSLALVWCGLGYISQNEHQAWLACMISIALPTTILIAIRLFAN